MDQIVNLTFSNAAIGQHNSVLNDIRQPAKNIAIYQRNPTFLDAELALVMLKPVTFRATGSIVEMRNAIQQYFETDHPNCSNLLGDLLEQLALFEQVSGAESFRLLFTTVNTNMCRRFHTDINSLRMLCTYVGQGTLWLPNEIVNTKAFLTQGNNEQIVLDENQVQQAGTGDVIILKGALFPDANPIVHRSPTIEEHGESRLMLRIDVNDALNF